MKTKSFLLGCAAGVVALTSAQAADLPVKAKPVQYVKLCNLYGAGFYYIPGTDTCIKIGGYLRAQVEANSFDGFSAGSTNSPLGPSTITDGLFNRSSNGINFTGRGAISVDARTESEYGTIRSYLHVGYQNATSGSAAVSFLSDRAFIQFAGFTFGLTQSFFDIFSNTELFTYTNAKTSGDTYYYGVTAWAYTASFGNGFSGTIAAEVQHNPAGVISGANGGFNAGSTTTSTAGSRMPDVVANLRIDQAWGYAGVSGAVHQVAGTYYSFTPVSGHPDDAYGWAAQIGGLVHLPGDNSFGVSFVGTEGAVGYVTKAGNWQMFNGSTVGVGWVTDGIFDNFLPNQKQIQLTTAWSVNAGFEHLWNQHWQTSVYGGYTSVSYNGTATYIINQHLPTPSTAPFSTACGAVVEGAVYPPIALNHGEGNSCSPNFSFWQVGTRTQWNVSNQLSLGLDVNYTHLNTAYKSSSPLLVAPYNAGASSATSVADQDVWSGILRVQRSFYP